MIFITGRSGAGKTTLLNIMSGIDNDYSGNVIYENCQAGVLKDEKKVCWYRKKKIDVIFQEYTLINSLTVEKNILLGIQVASKMERQKEFDNIVRKLGIDNLLKRKISELSGGERQRVAIARALLRNSEIIFADETTGNLDENNSKIIFQLLKEMSKERLVIAVTHDLESAEIYGDRIINIEDGKVQDDTYKRKINLVHEVDFDTQVNNKNQFLEMQICYKHCKIKITRECSDSLRDVSSNVDVFSYSISG